MKLLNQSIIYTFLSILAIIGLWGFVFFFNMSEEIRENVDEGLSNYKRQIISKAGRDTAILSHTDLEEGFYAIQLIDKEKALSYRDKFKDTIIYIQDIDDAMPEAGPARMLSTAFEDDGRYYELKIINPMVEKDKLIHRLLLGILWLYGFLVLTIILINNIVLQRLWKPFYELLRKIQDYRFGTSEKLPEIKTKTKEFKDLQRSVNALLKHNARIFDQQKQFIGNASHELQTPLAIVNNKLELLIEKGNIDKDQATDLSEMLDIINRMIKLNKSLLLLSKIENGQFLKRQPVHINQNVKQTIQDLAETITYKNIHLSISEEFEIIKEMDPSLAEILIGNLLRNAVFHNNNGGRVTIIFRENALIIINSGQNEALDPDKIFKRFYKSPYKRESSGLGLAITKAICDGYNISITYNYCNEEHNFKLVF